MKVDALGDHICCFVPGGRSLVTVGMPGVTNTSQFSGMSRVLTSVITLFPFLGLPAGVDPHGDVGHTLRVTLESIPESSCVSFPSNFYAVTRTMTLPKLRP